ncbi:hypothetical protein [Pseudoalteromonas sp. BDTF-M6]|uniref:hypothetical protein n=1 Tax=Pseudoalteromonas sp. BDTF-M6 TaxID=2796132 RepID=UPI001BAEC2C5|nr:hypothetical protein [Pseudoalteromonas sp. BDTF-M6]MBS3798383.1 hypothetical protein [Pseudoalteromonas sp. BDTF-M6]
MYFEKSLAVFMGGFVVWGFLMAMFFNLMLLGFKAKKDIQLVGVSILMFISYFTSDHFYNIFSGSEIYLVWLIYDLITLFLIFLVCYFVKSNRSAGVFYVVSGLIFNSVLFLCMHYDLAVKGNSEPWWFWSFYSIGVNIVDLLMIIVLIVDRDILGLISLKNYVKQRVKNQSSSFLNKFTQPFQIQQSQ